MDKLGKHSTTELQLEPEINQILKETSRQFSEEEIISQNSLEQLDVNMLKNEIGSLPQTIYKKQTKKLIKNLSIRAKTKLETDTFSES